MALRVASPSAARAKWIQRTGAAGQAYKDGIMNPRRPWAEATSAAAPTYAAGVQAAIGRNAFGNGVQRAGNSKWQRGATEKGSVRWAPGVQAAGADYEGGIGPYLSTLASLTLPDRGTAGSPQNEERSLTVQRALHAAKLARTGGA